MDKNNKNVLLVAQEIKLVKILAGNNKTLRERTLKRLSKFLSDRSRALPLTEDALMRIWKGLFYAMWMSDKPLIQEDCSEKIANLVHLKDINTSLLFFKCFLQTMINEYFGIDHFRMDKFLMLSRRILRHILLELHENEWQDAHINKFREILNNTILKIDEITYLGLRFHISEIFLEELAKVSRGNISENKVIELIQPFVQLFARSTDDRERQHINNHVFKYLINQTDIAIEYKEKFSAWKRQGFPGGSIDAMETIPLEDETGEDVEDPLEDLEGPADPRAGKVDVVLPQIRFDPLQVIKLLEEVQFKKYTTSKSRKAFKKIISQFELLSEGVYPLGLTKISIDKTEYSHNIKKSVQELQQFEKNIKHDSKKAQQKARKHQKAQELILQQLKDTKNVEPVPKKRKLEQKTPKPPKKQKLEPKLPIKSENYFKRNSGMWQVEEYEIPDSPEKPKTWAKPLQNGAPSKMKKKLKRLGEPKNRIPKFQEEFTEKILYGNAAKWTKQVVKNPFSEPTTPKGEKKIKFSSKIQAQEFGEHEKQIINSPKLPYDASKKPKKSLLKPSPYSSPINPFYNINKK